MSRDDRVVLDVDDGQLCVDGPDDVVDDVATALALPAVEVSAPDASHLSRVVQSRRPPRPTTTRLGKEVTWGTPQPDEDGPA